MRACQVGPVTAPCSSQDAPRPGKQVPRALVTSTPAKMAAVSEIPGRRSASTSGGRWLRCRYTWSLCGPTPRPSRISIVMLRDTTSRDARSLAVGAYLRRTSARR